METNNTIWECRNHSSAEERPPATATTRVPPLPPTPPVIVSTTMMTTSKTRVDSAPEEEALFSNVAMLLASVTTPKADVTASRLADEVESKVEEATQMREPGAAFGRSTAQQLVLEQLSAIPAWVTCVCAVVPAFLLFLAIPRVRQHWHGQRWRQGLSLLSTDPDVETSLLE